MEFVMLSRKTYNLKHNSTNNKHKMTKVAKKWQQPRVLRELRYRTITFLIYFLKKNKTKLKFGKGLAKQILK